MTVNKTFFMSINGDVGRNNRGKEQNHPEYLSIALSPKLCPAQKGSDAIAYH